MLLRPHWLTFSFRTLLCLESVLLTPRVKHASCRYSAREHAISAKYPARDHTASPPSKSARCQISCGDAPGMNLYLEVVLRSLSRYLFGAPAEVKALERDNICRQLVLESPVMRRFTALDNKILSCASKVRPWKCPEAPTRCLLADQCLR
jgi:hypothetical protein